MNDTQKIGIVGGSGFIGTRLVSRILEKKKSCMIIDKVKSKAYPELTQLSDIRDLGSLKEHLVGCNVVYNLAAEHRDDVYPRKLYDEVNVDGARNLCIAANDLNIKKIIFTSSVAVYGFAKSNTDEDGTFNPFNDYGRTKKIAESVFMEWQSQDPGRSLTIIRPTVVFGEKNRGNVYNLLKQIASGRFVMVGSGNNRKSMAYVENVAAFLEYSLSFGNGIHLFNYIDKPDFSMNELTQQVNKIIGKKGKINVRVPYPVGYLGGVGFDLIARILRRKLPISAIRVKKFCATTQFSSKNIGSTDFVAPVTLSNAIEKTVRYEFIDNGSKCEENVFMTE